MTKWTLIAVMAIAILAIGGCAQPTEAPELAPVEEQAVDANAAASNEQAAAEDEAVEEEAAAEEPTQVMVQAREHTPELAQLLGLAYKLPDGRTVTPAEADENQAAGGMEDVILVEQLTARGDLDADGDEDVAVILADVADPENPVLHLVTVVNENGTMTPTGVFSLPEGVGVSKVKVQDGGIVMDEWVPAEADPSCCPSQPMVVTYKSEDDYLTQVESRVASNIAVVTAMAKDIADIETAVPLATAVTAATAIAQATAGTAVSGAAAAPQATTPPQTGSTPPKVTMTIKPKDIGLKGQKVDIYAHAFDNPAIVKLELHIDGKAVSEWNSPTSAGVPYVHNTFTWRKAVAGIHKIKVIAYAADGSSTFSDEQIYPVK